MMSQQQASFLYNDQAHLQQQLAGNPMASQMPPQPQIQQAPPGETAMTRLQSAPAASSSSSTKTSSPKELQYTLLMMLVIALPTGTVEGLLHYVNLRSATRAAIVGATASSASIGALFAARAAYESAAKKPSQKELIIVATKTMISAAAASALVSRLDMSTQEPLKAGLITGLVAAWAAVEGKLLAKK